MERNQNTAQIIFGQVSETSRNNLSQSRAISLINDKRAVLLWREEIFHDASFERLLCLFGIRYQQKHFSNTNSRTEMI